MVYSIHPCLSLHLPQNNSQTEHPVSFSALRSSSQCHFLRRRRPWPARGAKELLSAARGREDTSIRSEWRRATKTRPSEVSHFLTLAWQRDQGQTLATWLPKHVNADPAVALGFSRETELHRLPETRSADRRQLSHDTAHSIARRLRAALSIGQRVAKRH
jgi:hypothetical protein